jgi:crotonobetainyl-CoA:carnitine CoA-transferase CaiB-like acyl-CoA transferase
MDHATRTQDEWMRTFIEEVDVPCDPFLTPQEFLAHPQMRENDRVVEIEDPDFGATTQLGPLVLGASTTIGAPAPRLGEHTQAVLGEVRTRSPQPPLARAAATHAAPLQGVTVLELAYYIAGPLGAACLAELGARVIKIEPREGDPWRPVGLESVHMLHGKESIVLDLKSPAGRTALQKLVATSDVLITSFRPQVHDKLGFDYETARRLNPGIIHLYAASYGSRGLWSNRAAFHSTPNALCGSGILQAGRDNPPVDDDYPDPIAGVSVGTAVAIALWARRRSGLGQHLETSMLCSGGYAFSDHLVLCDGLPPAPIPDSEQLGVSALRRLYQCAPGWLMLSAVQEREWSSLIEALDRPEWLTDVRFSSAAQRGRHDQVLAQLIATDLARRSADHWEQTLRKHDVGAARADRMSFEGFLIEHYDLAPASHPTFGDYYRLPPKVHIAGTTPRAAPACGVGEHTRAILEEIGCTADMVDEMTAYQAGGR